MLSKYWTFIYFWQLFTFKERSNILIFISQNEKQKQPQKKEKGGKRKRKNTFFQSINATGKLHFSAPNSEIQKTLSSGNEKRFSFPDIILFFLFWQKKMITCRPWFFHYLNICHKRYFLLNKKMNNFQSWQKKIDGLKESDSLKSVHASAFLCLVFIKQNF